ncbi:MAG: hypothetical protein ABIH57_00760, partial [Candidatus Omnitrophota bacterium]
TLIFAIFFSLIVNIGYGEEEGHMEGYKMGHPMGHELGYSVTFNDGAGKQSAIIIVGPYEQLKENENFELGSRLEGVQGIGWTREETTQVKDSNKVYDVVVVKTQNGGNQTFYFDITAPFVEKYGQAAISE